MNNSLDPVRVEVMKHELTSVAEEMAITMQRTARSLTAKEGADFSTALVDAEGRLIAQGLTIGIHLGYIKGVMPWVLEKFGEELREGDVIASNNPYGGVSHFPDIVLIMPIFADAALVGFSTIVAHHTDIGGRFPGGMGAACATVYEEGICIPGVRLVSEGIKNEALLETLAANVRAPDDLLGDLDAQMAACKRGVDGVRAIVERHGIATFDQCNAELRHYSEMAMRRTIESIPDGRYDCEDFFEDDGIGGEGVQLALVVIVDGDELTVDFAGTAGQVLSAINVPISLTSACVYVAMRSLLGSDIPANEGLMTPIQVHAPCGSVLNPKFPGAVGARGMMMWRIIDMIFAALAKAVPDRVYAAGEGGMNVMVYTPEDCADGRGMVIDIYAGGWGARPDRDGIEGVTPLAAGGATRSLPAEMVERECPVMLTGFGFVPDTGGAGQYRGGLSVYRRWRFLEPGRVLLRTCRVDSVPYGLNGGQAGTPFRATLTRNGVEQTLPSKMMIDLSVQIGDEVTHVQPGPGGYGDPRMRSRDAVLDDLANEKISEHHARDVYGLGVSSVAD